LGHRSGPRSSSRPRTRIWSIPSIGGEKSGVDVHVEGACKATVEISETPKVTASGMKDEQLWISGWWADYPDPDGFFRGLLRVGWPFYQDEDIAELLRTEPRAIGLAEMMNFPGVVAGDPHELDKLAGHIEAHGDR
jgi:hypothetical protein